MFHQYAGVVTAVLVVLILACWNPPQLQQNMHGKPTGCPNFLWIALFALLVGICCVYLCQENMKK